MVRVMVKIGQSNHPEIIVPLVNIIQNVATNPADLLVVAVRVADDLGLQVVLLDVLAERVYALLLTHVLLPQGHQLVDQVQHHHAHFLIHHVQVDAALLEQVLLEGEPVGEGLISPQHQMGEDVVELDPKLGLLLVAEHDHDLLHNVGLAEHLVGGGVLENIVGQQPAPVPSHFPVFVVQQRVHFLQNVVLRQIVRVVLGLCEDIPQSSDRVGLQLLVGAVHFVDDLAHHLLRLNNVLDDVILLVVGHLVDCPVDDGVLSVQVGENVLERNALLADMVDQQPQIRRVVLDDLEYLCFPPDDQVACHNHAHFLNLGIGHLNQSTQVVFEFLGHLFVVGEVSDLLHRHQGQQTLIGHVGVDAGVVEQPCPVEFGLTPPVVRDGEQGGFLQRRQCGGDGPFDRLLNQLLSSVIVMMQI